MSARSTVITIAGQLVSMVDIRDPDLEPGDAIFIPSLWWHCVEAYAPVNILVNFGIMHRRNPGPLQP